MSPTWLCGLSCYSWVLISVTSFVGWFDPQTGWQWGWTPNYSAWAAIQGMAPWSRIHHNRVWCLLRSPFGCQLWYKLGHSLMWSEIYHWMFWTWASWEGLLCRLISDAACDCPGYLFGTVTHRLWLPLLGGCTWVDPSCMPMCMNPGAGQQKAQVSPRSASACQMPLVFQTWCQCEVRGHSAKVSVYTNASCQTAWGLQTRICGWAGS